MPENFHINVKETPLEFDAVSKYKLERQDHCIKCGKCTKSCIYHVHNRCVDDPRKMAGPVNHECRNCFRCIQECPRGALILSISPEFRKLGDSYWTPDIILSTWKQAENGAVPVTGAGYKGPFTGPYFDSMWTDMSEIVRPTRDGIHGREYINTSVDIGNKLSRLKFDSHNNIALGIPLTVDIPIPILFDAAVCDISSKIGQAAAQISAELQTFTIFPIDKIKEHINYSDNIIPLLTLNNIGRYKKEFKHFRIIAKL